MSSLIEQTSFLNGANATFVAEIYAKFLENPDNVDPSWRDFFGTLHDDARELLEDLRTEASVDRFARTDQAFTHKQRL